MEDGKSFVFLQAIYFVNLIIFTFNLFFSLYLCRLFGFASAYPNRGTVVAEFDPHNMADNTGTANLGDPVAVSFIARHLLFADDEGWRLETDVETLPAFSRLRHHVSNFIYFWSLVYLHYMYNSYANQDIFCFFLQGGAVDVNSQENFINFADLIGVKILRFDPQADL